MKPKRISGIVLLSMCLGLVGAAWGEDSKAPPSAKDGQPKDAAKKPPNPLLDDPFVGEFEGDGLGLTIKPAGEKTYTGEIRRNGRSFPCKVTREGDRYTGAFTFEDFSYEFSVTLEGKTLKLAMVGKLFTLRLKPKEAPKTTPDVPSTVPTEIAAAPAPLPVDYSRLSTAELTQVGWSRFQPASTVVYEETVSDNLSLPATVKTKVSFEGVKEGKIALKAKQSDDGAHWVSADRPAAAPTEGSLRIDEFGYTGDEPRDEDLVVEKATLQCQRATYTGQREVKGSPMVVKVEVWRCRDVDHAMIVMDLPQHRLLIEPDMVKVVATITYGGAKVARSLELEALRREFRVGNQMLSCAVMRGSSTATTADAAKTIERKGEYLISHQVPGGMVKSTDTERQGVLAQTRTNTLVEFSTGTESREKR